MTYSYPGFRRKIVVFGETYKALDVDDKTNPEDPIVLYQNVTEKGSSPRAAPMSDWIAWDVNATNARQRVIDCQNGRAEGEKNR